MVSCKSIKIDCITPSNGFIHVTSANETPIKNTRSDHCVVKLSLLESVVSYIVILIKVTGTPPNTNQSQPTGGCGPSAMGGVSCPSQVPPSGGCGGMPCGSPNGTSNG